MNRRDVIQVARSVIAGVSSGALEAWQQDKGGRAKKGSAREFVKRLN
jgi:hypothetical protein